MGLESLLMVEPFFLIFIKLWHHCYVFKKKKTQNNNSTHLVQILHILGGRRAENWTAVTALLQCLVLQGEIKEGERPPRQTLQNAPLSFTSQPNLNLTMEPAQYECNPIHGPASSVDLPEYLLLAQNCFSVI